MQSQSDMYNGNTTMAALDRRAQLGGRINTAALFTKRQVFIMQLVSCILAGISLASDLIIFYWFCLMRTSFRHRYCIDEL